MNEKCSFKHLIKTNTPIESYRYMRCYAHTEGAPVVGPPVHWTNWFSICWLKLGKAFPFTFPIYYVREDHCMQKQQIQKQTTARGRVRALHLVRGCRKEIKLNKQAGNGIFQSSKVKTNHKKFFLRTNRLIFQRLWCWHTDRYGVQETGNKRSVGCFLVRFLYISSFNVFYYLLQKKNEGKCQLSVPIQPTEAACTPAEVERRAATWLPPDPCAFD